MTTVLAEPVKTQGPVLMRRLERVLLRVVEPVAAGLVVVEVLVLSAGVFARYVLNRASGEVRLVDGPCMYLPDPRQDVLVRRILDDRQIDLWFPFNPEAKAWHLRQRLMAAVADDEVLAMLRSPLGPMAAR